MDKQLAFIGRLAGIAGILLCVVAVILRFLGFHQLHGINTVALLLTGTSAVVIACFLLLLARAESR